MKKITLKIFTFLLLTMFVLQVQGQIVPGELYTIRNAATGNFMGAGDCDAGKTIMTPTATYTIAEQNFIFVDALTAGFTNISPQDTGGSLRQASLATLNTLLGVPNDNSDRRWVLEEVDVSNPNLMLYRFKYSTSPRYIYETTTDPGSGNFYPLTPNGPNDPPYTLDQSSVWAVQPATNFPLSTEEFDTSSIFISNPVNNQLSIKGLPSNVKQVSVYSLLGQEVLAREVDGQSSLTIDVSTLTSGMYLVEMKGDVGTFTKKIVKQ